MIKDIIILIALTGIGLKFFKPKKTTRQEELMGKVFISNITSNERYTPDLHRLVCDVRREGENNIEKQKTWVLSHEEYKSVIATGSYRTK